MRAVPVIHRADGRPDTVAHHVLIALATFSDSDGRNARPSVDSLADACWYGTKAVAAALQRLAEHGLIEADGTYGATGVTRWRLCLEVTREPTENKTFEERRAVQREKAAARARKYRATRTVVPAGRVTPSDAVMVQTVTHPQGVTHDEPNHVTPSDAVRHAPAGRDVTPSQDVRHALTTVISADHSPVPALDLPVDLPIDLPSTATPSRARSALYTEDFETFWAAFGRHGVKAEAAREWQRAIKRADPAVIMAAVPPYVASKPVLEYRKRAQNWLAGDGWESVIVPTGHQTYRNPTDLSEYDDDLLPAVGSYREQRRRPNADDTIRDLLNPTGNYGAI